MDNLKSQMAQDGCSDLQFDLAKQLLKDEVGEVTVESHHQGINWLLRAANQGHEEAIVLLTDCYSTRRGINESNECEVRLCLEMSPAERAARKAARELFLCLSNGGEFFTASQLENKMREIYQMDEDVDGNRRLGSASTQYLNHHNNSEILTEANLITAAVNYSNGRLPNLNTTICVTTPHPDSLNHIPSFFRPLFHPILFLTLLYYRLVERLATLPDLLWHYKLPFLLLLYLLGSQERGVLLQFIPTAVYLLSVALMVVATFRMLKANRDFVDFRLWSGLFQHFGRELELYRENTEFLFLRNNLRPYLYFFIALVVNVLLRPVVRHEWLPCAEITIVAVALAVITALVFLYSTNKKTKSLFPNVFIVMSLLVNVLAKYPYVDTSERDGWHVFDSLFPSGHLIGSGIELRLNLKALFCLLIPVVLVQIGSCDKWRGVYKYLIPHCVTLSWMQLAMSYAQDSTLRGLARATAELLSTVLFLPLMGLATMLLPVLTAVETFLLDQKVKVIAFIVLATTLIILYGYLSNSRKWSKWLLPIQITLYSIAIFTYVVPAMEKNLKILEDGESLFGHDQEPLGHGETYTGLSWDTYSKYCQSTPTRANRIETQLRCAMLDEEIVRWEGTVKSVDILRARNYKRDLLAYVYPKQLRNMLVCLFGEPNAVYCPPHENCGNVQDFVEGRWKCNVNKWNVYTYSIQMKMDTGMLKSAPSVRLTAGHEYGNFTRHLQLGDRIWFEGALRSSILQREEDVSWHSTDDLPLVELQSVGCLACHNADLKFVLDPSGNGSKAASIMSVVQTSFKYLLNAIFNPVLVFK